MVNLFHHRRTQHARHARPHTEACTSVFSMARSRSSFRLRSRSMRSPRSPRSLLKSRRRRGSRGDASSGLSGLSRLSGLSGLSGLAPAARCQPCASHVPAMCQPCASHLPSVSVCIRLLISVSSVSCLRTWEHGQHSLCATLPKSLPFRSHVSDKAWPEDCGHGLSLKGPRCCITCTEAAGKLLLQRQVKTGKLKDKRSWTGNKTHS